MKKQLLVIAMGLGLCGSAQAADMADMPTEIAAAIKLNAYMGKKDDHVVDAYKQAWVALATQYAQWENCEGLSVSHRKRIKRNKNIMHDRASSREPATWVQPQLLKACWDQYKEFENELVKTHSDDKPSGLASPMSMSPDRMSLVSTPSSCR